MPQIVQWRCPQSTRLSQALTVSVSSTRSVVGAGQAGQVLGLAGRFGLRKSFETSRSLVLQGIGETPVRRGTLRPSRSFVVLRCMRNHQFAVILLVKAGTLGDISVKQKRHAMSNGVQPSLCELAWARDGVPSPATHPKSRLKSTQLQTVFKEAKQPSHPNYLTPDKLHLRPRGPRKSTSSTSQRDNKRSLDLRVNEHYKINRTDRSLAATTVFHR